MSRFDAAFVALILMVPLGGAAQERTLPVAAP